MVNEIIKKIKKSRKYKGVYGKTIERIVVDCVARFGQKRAEKEAKNLLHQIWGAFYSNRPDFEKILKKIKKDIIIYKKADIQSNTKELWIPAFRLPAGRQAGMTKEIILPVLKLQSSVYERVSILENFYKKIFEIIDLPAGGPISIIDHACGLNPLTIPWMNLPENTEYTAYDIDGEEINFLNQIFDLFKNTPTHQRMGVNTKFALGDILCDEFDYADVVFMLKLLPCLEHQKKNCSLDILRKQKCKYLVISFPIKSIGGKDKGMTSFYGNSFKNMIKEEKWQVSEILFDTELVFVIKK